MQHFLHRFISAPRNISLTRPKPPICAQRETRRIAIHLAKSVRAPRGAEQLSSNFQRRTMLQSGPVTLTRLSVWAPLYLRNQPYRVAQASWGLTSLRQASDFATNGRAHLIHGPANDGSRRSGPRLNQGDTFPARFRFRSGLRHWRHRGGGSRRGPASGGRRIGCCTPRRSCSPCAGFSLGNSRLKTLRSLLLANYPPP